MKYAIFILLLFLFSCEKPEKETCWTCTTMVWQSGHADHKTVHEEFDTCEEGVMLLYNEKWRFDKTGGTISRVYYTTCK